MTTDIDWIAVSAVLTFGAVAVALGIGVYNGFQAKGFENNRYRSGQLKIIADWAIALHTAPLTSQLPFVDMTRIFEAEITGALPKRAIADLKNRVFEWTRTNKDVQRKLIIGNAFALGDFVEEIAKNFDNKSGKLSILVREATKTAMFSRILESMSEGESFDNACRGIRKDMVEEAKKDFGGRINNKNQAQIELNISQYSAAESIDKLLMATVDNMP